MEMKHNLYFPLNKEIRKINLANNIERYTVKISCHFQHFFQANLGYMIGSYRKGFDPLLVNFPLPYLAPLGGTVILPKKEKK